MRPTNHTPCPPSVPPAHLATHSAGQKQSGRKAPAVEDKDVVRKTDACQYSNSRPRQKTHEATRGVDVASETLSANSRLAKAHARLTKRSRSSPISSARAQRSRLSSSTPQCRIGKCELLQLYVHGEHVFWLTHNEHIGN